MSLSSPYVIETHGLSKLYKDTQALNSLDLKVRHNSIFGFLGPNGAGKTTTIKLMLGLTAPHRERQYFWHGQRNPECGHLLTHWLSAAGTSFL